MSQSPRLSLLPLALLVLSACATAQEPAAVATAADRFAQRTSLNGVVLVAQGDRVIHTDAFGHANIEEDLATSLDTRYQLGSISKWISSLVVLRLVDEGVLDLDVPIATYLPDLPSDTGRRVTLHHLLTHTSGIPNDFVRAIQEDMSILTVDLATPEAVRRYASGDLAFAPGSEFDYSHSNWIVVKAIIEAASGETFSATLATLLTEPLGLESTGAFSGAFASVPNSAVGYTSVAPTPERMTETIPDYAVAAGGLYSTAPDLLSLLNKLYNGDVLSEASLERLDTVVVEDEIYAYGGRVRTMDLGGQPERLAWHTGSNGPFKSRVSRVLSSGLTVITLSNTGASHDDTEAFTEAILALQIP